MIRRISASDDRFKTVTLGPHFNLILAERKETSTDRDSRNGLGKSLLLEIIHFCLGSKGTKGRGVVVDDLSGWRFRVDLRRGAQDLAFARRVDEPRWIEVDSSYEGWPVQPKISDGRAQLSVPNQRTLLGRLLYGLDEDTEEARFGPTFRSLFSYQVRRGPDGFLDPFTHDRNQQTWDKQANILYQLGLNWQDAAAFQELRADKKVIDTLASAMKEGSLPAYLGSEGELEAERVRLTGEIAEKSDRLASFEVREDYREIEQQANELAEEIHILVNENIRAGRRADLYASRLDEERDAVISGVEVERLFAEAEVALPDQIQRRLADLKVFHDAVIENRTAYLNAEITRLRAEIDDRTAVVARLDGKKAELLGVLATSGALEEFTRLQDLLGELRGKLRDVEARLDRLREVTQARAAWEERRAQVSQGARTRWDELRAIRDQAIAQFNANTQALYETPGRLIIDVTDKGFEFDVKIDRSDSHGVSLMKIFCFDLMLMQLWAERGGGPGFLIHDSALFDGVDERQVAAALDLAHKESNRLGFQYICSLNSDDLPRDELGEGHPVLKEVALELNDADPSGMLLGMEF